MPNNIRGLLVKPAIRGCKKSSERLASSSTLVADRGAALDSNVLDRQIFPMEPLEQLTKARKDNGELRDLTASLAIFRWQGSRVATFLWTRSRISQPGTPRAVVETDSILRH